MSRIGKVVTAASFAVALLIACGDKNAPFPPGTSGGAGMPDGGGTANNTGVDGACGVTPPPNTGVSFLADILPLMKRSCSCHVTGPIPPLLDNYANVRAAAEPSMAAIAAGTMPIAAPLAAEERALFESWIAAGMPNN